MAAKAKLSTLVLPNNMVVRKCLLCQQKGLFEETFLNSVHLCLNMGIKS